MKTTLDIPDALMRQLRERAACEGTTMRALVTDALRNFLTPRKQGAKKFKLRDASVRGDGLMPGIREGDWEQLREIIYEGRGGFPGPTDTRTRKAG